MFLAAITVAFQAILVYAGYKIVMSRLKQIVAETTKFALESVKMYAEEWMNSDTGQKAMFNIGEIVGAGAKKSIMGKNSGGKWGWLETIVDLGKQVFSDAKNAPKAQEGLGSEGLKS